LNPVRFFQSSDESVAGDADEDPFPQRESASEKFLVAFVEEVESPADGHGPIYWLSGSQPVDAPNMYSTAEVRIKAWLCLWMIPAIFWTPIRALWDVENGRESRVDNWESTCPLPCEDRFFYAKIQVLTIGFVRSEF
jgi:hypothetical protein